MHFSSIRLYNYGIYKGEHEMRLSDRDGEKNITLVGGMNGRGKTTLLDSVFLCLYGRKATEYITGKKMAYHKVLSERINKSAGDQHTYIRLTMEMDDGEGTVIAVTRAWTWNGTKLDTTLTVEKNGLADSYLSENWEYYVEELIPFGIAKFFFFDNEKISQIADDEAFDKIKDSIQSVIGVTTISSLCARIEKIRKDKSASLKKSEDSALAREATEVEAAIAVAEGRKRELQARKAGLLPELEKNADQLEQTEQAFWKKGGNLGFNRDNIEKEQQALKERSAALKEEARQLAANPATPLGLCRKLVTQTYERMKTDEEARARHYALPVITKLYGELLEDLRQSRPEAAGALEELVQKQLAALSSEQSQVSTLTPQAQELTERYLCTEQSTITGQAARIIAENETNAVSLAQLEVHLSSSAEKNDTIQLLEKIKELQTQKTRIEGEIAKCDEKLRSANFELEQLERQQNKLLLKLAADADASDDSVRLVEYATMTLEVMQEFVKRLQTRKVSLLEENITKCFEFLAQKEGIITSISIDPDTLDITLRDYEGGLLLKDQLSAGEKQMFAISILWGLALSSGYELPVMIDTPMARLDSAHRTNFINRYLPKASSQVIVLSTDEEINGQYLADIRQFVNRTYTLVYDETDKCTSIQPGYFGGDSDDM